MYAPHARVVSRLWLALVLASVPAGAAAQPPPDGIATLLTRLEQAAGAADRGALLALADPAISRPSFDDFASTLTSPPPTRVVVNERDRAALPEGPVRLVVEVFSERGNEGRLGTWRVDVRPGATPDAPWRIAAVERLSVVTGLYRLSLDTDTQYDIHDLVVRAPDLTLEMASGHAFVARTPDGPTAMVLRGRGQMRFTPPDPAERTQVRIFSDSDELATNFDMAFLRFAPQDFDALFQTAALQPRAAVNPSDLRSATGFFNDLVGRSLQIDLSDISKDRWSLAPVGGDLIAELRTRKYGTLTYARSSGEAEDVTVFDRRRRRNISVYTSAEKLARRGRFYSEDARTEFDVLAYEIDVQFNPDRSWFDGDVRMKIRIRSQGTSSLTLKLAEAVVVKGVYSPDYGRLLHLRVVGQSSVIVNLPAVVTEGTDLWLNVVYGGQVPPQTFDREAIQVGAPPQMQERIEIPLQPQFLYSNRSYWYPQPTVTDYASARIRITVPNDYDVIATGEPTGPPVQIPAGDQGQRRRKTYVFEATRPARYLALLVSRFSRLEPTRLDTGRGGVSLQVQSTPRVSSRMRDMGESAAGIVSFYASLLGEAPYPSFTLALAESDRPGGHSPPYFAIVNQVVPGSAFIWRNDPVSFSDYPDFFLAHEVAHQWWGHGVGWKNYHEQWISEGFAQYFAALYAEHDRQGDALPNVLRQMRRTAIAASDQGPIYLGYRLGHIRGDERVFRALVYNKGAMVLHMLRRLVGDDAFFGGVRAFYRDFEFRKAGTDDFQRAMERATGRDLQRFFDTWVFGSAIPRLKFSYRVDEGEARVRFEQPDGAIDAAITVTIEYRSGGTDSLVVPLEGTVTERTIPLKGEVRRIEANADNGALVEIDR